MQDGDVIIHREGQSLCAYVLRSFAGDLQCRADSYEDAVRLAARLAEQVHVDAWYTEDEETIRRVVQRRPG